MIPQRNLSVLSNRLANARGRRLPEAVLERDDCLAWFLVALSRTPCGQVARFSEQASICRPSDGGNEERSPRSDSGSLRSL